MPGEGSEAASGWPPSIVVRLLPEVSYCQVLSQIVAIVLRSYVRMMHSGFLLS